MENGIETLKGADKPENSETFNKSECLAHEELTERDLDSAEIIETIRGKCTRVTDGARELKEQFFDPKNTIPETRVSHLSPSGKYELVTTNFKTKEGCWDFKCGVVSNNENSRIIAEVHRNYSNFPFAFVEGHKNGHDYLICGENYQGQTIIELDTGKRVDYVPHAEKSGYGFCGVNIKPSPDGSMLGIEGCIWARPYEVVIVDFKNPMDPPYAELHGSEYCDLLGWDDDNSCSIGILNEVLISNGKTFDELSDEEIEELDRLEKNGVSDDKIWKKVVSKQEKWTRPSNIDRAREYITSCIELFQSPFIKERKIPISLDVFEMIKRHLENLTEEERARLINEPKIKDLLVWALAKKDENLDNA